MEAKSEHRNGYFRRRAGPANPRNRLAYPDRTHSDGLGKVGGQEQAVTEHHTEMFDVPDKTQPPAFWYHHRSDEADDYLVYDPRCEKCRIDKGLTAAEWKEIVETPIESEWEDQ